MAVRLKESADMPVKGLSEHSSYQPVKAGMGYTHVGKSRVKVVK